MNHRLMLLLHVDCFHLENHRMLLANLLTAASQLLAKEWKSHTVPELWEEINIY